MSRATTTRRSLPQQGKGGVSGGDDDSSTTTMVKAKAFEQRPSKIPVALRFPLVATLSLTISALLYSATTQWTGAELGRVSRRLERWEEVGALVGWRSLELAVGWFGDYDSYDLTSLTMLAHGPTLYLLNTFYEVNTTAVVLSLVIDALATYIPFRLLRPLSLAHAASNFQDHVAVPNEEIVTSPSIQAYTTLLSSLIYGTTLFTAYSSYLPVYLVTYFNNIPTIAATHSATPLSLLPVTLILGLSAKSFIFTPAAAVGPSREDAKLRAFNPSTATLSETFWYNVWGFDKRTKTVIKRTAALMAVCGGNTFLQTWMTLEGVETMGAVGYSAVWVVAAGLTGAALGVVGAV